jgi:hypothetical protein
MGWNSFLPAEMELKDLCHPFEMGMGDRLKIAHPLILI